ncbi:MAG: lipopolysaccharide heptosyltransferase I [Pseudomonadales bacterium]|nr:lipopolysaccharide heptosyltransferase I [Pseudomonadales bacterium]MBO7007171.1 lipopolysaccharide heptosyltransferase I [Pseudomonadales bacterium]
MKVLLVKTSSLGDIVHALPAVTDALQAIPELVIDWVVEEAFKDIPERHVGVRRVIPVAIRRWRQQMLKSAGEFSEFRAQLLEDTYDLVLDSQGLFKSALTGWLAKGPLCGFSGASAREPVASKLYRKGYDIDVNQHAILRQKQLFASAIGYPCPDAIDFGLKKNPDRKRRLAFFHGTTWLSKEWPLAYWQRLAIQAIDEGYELLVPAGSEEERARAEAITAAGGDVLYRPSLSDLIERLSRCQGAVSVDTGLGHLAPALGVPMVGLFGATDPSLTGMLGQQAKVLASTHLPCIPCRERDCQYKKSDDSSKIHPPCYEPITPETVWQALQQQTGNPSPSLD